MGQVVQAKADGRLSRYGRGVRNAAFVRYGQEFYRAGRKAGSPLVRYYLVGHALELFLKGFLLSRGLNTSVLKSQFGHNIDRLLAESITKDFGVHFHVSRQLQTEITQFSSVYTAKVLQYFSMFYLLSPPRLPDMSRIMKFVGLLDRRLQEVVKHGT